MLPRNPSLWDKLANGFGEVFTGQNDPRLSADQNAAARKQAMLQSGLAMLLASRGGPDGRRPDLASIIAQGALAGQDTGYAARAQAFQIAQVQAAQQAMQARQNAVQQLLANTPPDKLAFAAGALAQRGWLDEAKAVAGLAKDLTPNVPGVQQVRIGDEVLLVDSISGDVKATFKGQAELEDRIVGNKRIFSPKGKPNVVVFSEPAAAQPRASGQPQTYRDAATGELRLGVWNNEARRFEPVQGALPAQDPGTNTEQARMARALSPVMEQAYGNLAKMDTPDFRNAIANASTGVLGVGNYLKTPAGRQFDQASEQFLGAVLSILSGKTVSEQEVQRNKRAYVPQPGDDAQTIAAKFAGIQTLLNSARMLGGLPQQQNTPQPQEPEAAPPVTVSGSLGPILTKYMSEPKKPARVGGYSGARRR